MDSHIFRYSMSLATLLLSSVVGASYAAAAAPAPECLDNGLADVRKAIKGAKLAAANLTKVRPALQYDEGVQTNATTNEQREEKFIGNVIYGMKSALKGFRESGNPSADNIWPVARNDVKIPRRSQSDVDSGAGPSTKSCGSSCGDMALRVRQFYVSQEASPREAVDRLSQYKLATTSDSRVKYCVPSDGCQKLLSSENPPAMAIGKPYLVDETQVIQFPFENIVSRSVYQVTEVNVCGKKSYLITTFLTGDEGSFDNASTMALVTEVNGKTVVVGEYQGYVGNGNGPVPAIFLSFLSGRATAKLAGMYNTQAGLIGSTEQVDNIGRLKTLPKDQALPLASGNGAGSSWGKPSGGNTKLQR